ncbi:MAG: hypothetical protein KF752_12485 [Pirellulaceae bacterium]|nr:hypothetical protein [Pirellulaceae bacterium]
MKSYLAFGLALTLGMGSDQSARAQYAPYHYNTGPSSYAVQSPYGPPVPGYHLAAVQDNSGAFNQSGQALPVVPTPAANQPVPMAQQYAPVPMAAPPLQQSYTSPANTESSYQSIAPGCTSCGTQPVGQPESGGYFPGYAYSAPSVGCGPACQAAPGCGSGWGHGSFMGHGFGAGCGLGGMPCGAKPWFAGGSVLIFRRIDDHNRLLSVDDSGAGVLYTQDAQLGTMAGFETMAGRYFNCGRNAIAVSYWGLFPETQSVAVYDDGGGLRSSLFRPWGGPDPWTGEYQWQAGPVADDTTDPDVYGLYDTADTHQLRRSSSFHNVEINLLGFGVGGAARNFNRSTAGSCFSGSRAMAGPWRGGMAAGAGHSAYNSCGDCNSCAPSAACAPCGPPSKFATGPCCYVAPACGSRLNLSWLAGVRYFRFGDDLYYDASDIAGYPAQVLSYHVCTVNHLVGFQIGGRSDFCVGNRLNLYSTAKAGIYGNSASLDSNLRTAGYFAYVSGDPSTQFNIERSGSDVAFLSELGTGCGVRLSSKWTATAGYRAMIATGVATAVGNIRHQGQTLAQTQIYNRDCLVLHGLNIGALYNF